jgi:muramoyltetrapeptide carboxypeptidase LdcA involved in peptidoglycan recycling
LKTLAEHIAQQLKERGFCVIFDRDLERCWPSSRMSRGERERKIQEFAESQGCNAAILDAGFGTRAILQKLELGIDAASI